MRSRARVAALLILTACALGACGGPGHVQYDNDCCLIDGHEATLSVVEARQAAVAQRIQSRQPWFAVVTIIFVIVAGASNAGKVMVLFRARKHEGEDRPLAERLRDALDRHRESPVRFGAIVGVTVGLLLVAASCYIYLDVDKRASERALGMLQFCHLALRTSAEQGVLAEQRKNLSAIQSTAGDIRALVDKLPPEEKQKAREIVAQMNTALEKQGKIVGDFLVRSDEQQKALEQHNTFVEKTLTSLSGDVGALKGSVPASLKDLGDEVKRLDGKLDGKLAGEDDSVKALQASVGELDGKLTKLLARPACEPPKPAPVAAKPASVAAKPAPSPPSPRRPSPQRRRRRSPRSPPPISGPRRPNAARCSRGRSAAAPAAAPASSRTRR